MNTKFENKYFGTDKMLSEYVHKVMCRKLKLVGTILFAICFVLLIITLYENDYVFSMMFGIFLPMLFFVAFLIPLITLRQMKENDRRIHNGKIVETIIKFGDNISISEGSFNLTVEYSQIQQIHSLKHSYVLMFGKNNAIMISPEHFTVGTFEDFLNFINSKVILTNN